jgi:cell division protein FtsZ
MPLNLNVPKTGNQLTPRITVIGVGGAGGNAVNNMIQSNLEGVDFLVANTDAQALEQSHCDRRIQLGVNTTQGLGAGSRPDVGRAAAEEGLDEILGHLDGTNMVFITAGLGGGTGTGSAPVIARATREAGILTVGVVTKPFHFEGVHRMRMAEAGLTELQQFVDTLIIIPNQNLFRVANEKTTFADAFKMADDVLESGVRGVTDLIVMPGLINLDFADIRAVMTEMGKAMMGTGEAEGEQRAIEAAESAISNPLLDEVSMKGARGVLINITGGGDLTLFEVDEAANRIRDEVDSDANIIFGSTFDEALEGKMRVSVVSTGIDADQIEAPKPMTLSLVTTSQLAGLAASADAAPAASANATMAGELAAQSTLPVAETPATGVSEVVATAAASPVVDAPAAETMTAGATALALDTEVAAEPLGYAAPQAESESAPAEQAAWAEGFIAPPPIEPDPQPTSAEPAEAEADPFAAAAIVNAAREPAPEATDPTPPGRRRTRNLFARMAGAARFAADAKETGESQVDTASAQPAMKITPSSQAVPKPAEQSSLSGLDPNERIEASAEETELLDIPAFLRRQAN